ncbi:PAS domain-containing sensor histidine kinase [Pseudomonas sp. X10]
MKPPIITTLEASGRLEAANHSADVLFDDLDRGLLLTAEDGRIESANLTFCRWIGYTREDLLRLRIQDLMSLEARTFHQAYWRPLMRLQGAVASVKFELVHHIGYSVPMMLSAISCAHSSGIFHELTLFKAEDWPKYERELVNARLLAERHLANNLKVQRAKDIAQGELYTVYAAAEDRAAFAEQMLGIVTHDLRNPLSAIKMAAEILCRREQDAKTTQLLGHITRSTERAQRLVADLLDFTQIRVGRGIAINPTPLNPHEAVASCLDELRLAFPEYEVLHKAIGEGVLVVDSDRLCQMLGNLVANAMAYGDSKFPVTVTSCVDAETVTFAIHNQGPPIPAGLSHNLFEPMIRGHNENAELRSVGLGLFIVREIAKAHGGEVRVVSSESEGTSFIVMFPRV